VFVGAGFDNFALGSNFSLRLLHILAFDLVVERIFVTLLFALMLFKWNLRGLFQTVFRFGLKRCLKLAFFLSKFNNFYSLALFIGLG